MTDAVTTDSGPLSVDQAIASLIPQETTEPEAVATEAPLEAAAETETPSEAEETTAETGEEAEGATEAEAEPEEAVAPLEAPKYWSHEAKAKFADLPPELQAVVLSQEGPREEAAAKAKAEAAQLRQTADKELQGVQKLAEQLNTFLPEAVKTFKSRWEDVDWSAWVEQDPEAAFKGKIAFETEQQHLQKLAAAAEEAQAQAHQAFLREQTEKLREIAPELADPEKGVQRRTDVAKYLVAQGVDQSALNSISAVELTIAHKAMLFDQAKANLQAAPKPKPAASKPVVKPAAATSHNPARQAVNRFAQTRSVEDAVALLMSQGQ